MKQMTDPTLQWGKWLGGAVAGAALMYMLDPERGGARRAQSTEKIRDLSRQTGSALGSAVRSLGGTLGSSVEGLSHTLDGAAGQAQQAARPDGQAGQAAASAMQGASQSASQAMQRASEGAGKLMQEARQVAQSTVQRMRGDWAPGMRGAAMLGGGMLGLYGLMRRSPIGMTLGMAGLALLARGATNQSLKNMLTGKAMGQTIELEKSIWIDASPEQVYDLWTNFENFPHFMSHVVEVRDLGARRSHWVVKGPAGTQFEWNAVITEQSRPHRLAWRSEPGSEIEQSGSIEFEPEAGGTRVTVRMSYSPPAGMLGHGIATLLGADPKRQMDEDLARMKAFIERGTIPRDAAQRTGGASRFLH
jgi:uncharacterized membrane protein